MNAPVVRRTCRLKRGALYILALLPCLFVTSANSAGSSDHPFLFSSATSPNGIWIAENFGYNDCCSGGFVSIHKVSEPAIPSEAPIVSSSPSGGTFLIWQDDDHLSLLQDAESPALMGPKSYRGIAILYSRYQVRRNDRNTFNGSNSRMAVDIEKDNALAEFVSETTRMGKRCTFSLIATDGGIFDKIGMKIEASVNRCDRLPDCGGITSRFWVGKRIDGQRNIALTSATVSDIPSNNRIPDGDRNGSVSGHFAGENAADLVRSMDLATLEIQYSLNFFDAVISYRIETGRIKNAIDAFKVCIGDADLDWVAHGKKLLPRAGSP